MPEVDVSVLPKQKEFLEATERQVLYSGAFGAGKTRALCIKAAMRATIRGAREALCRKHLVTFKATTLRVLLEEEAGLPPVLPLGSYRHNKADKIIRLNGGGEIVYFGLDDERKIGSYALSGVGVDEAVELTAKDWRQLRGRVRLKVPDLPGQIYAATNPGPPTHWMAQRFGLAAGYKARKGCRTIHTCSDDNHFLPQEYLDDLHEFEGVALKRYVLGKWAGTDGLVYDAWDREVFVQKRDTDWRRCMIGVDEGYRNPQAHILVLVDGDGRRHIAKEWYQRKQLEPAKIAHLKGWTEEYDPEAIKVDPSAAGLIAALQDAGLPAEKANNDVQAGIAVVQKHMVVGGDGRPRTTVDPSCENTIREFETYENRPDGEDGYLDQPIKKNDHSMDGDRYAMIGLEESETDWASPTAIGSSVSDRYDKMLRGE